MFIMKELYHFVLDNIFNKFIEDDSEFVKVIDNYSGDVHIASDTLIFTLPALFKLACVLYQKHTDVEIVAEDTDYLSFRKALYNNPTNTILKERKGIVEVELSNDDHNLSTYKLSRL